MNRGRPVRNGKTSDTHRPPSDGLETREGWGPTGRPRPANWRGFCSERDPSTQGRVPFGPTGLGETLDGVSTFNFQIYPDSGREGRWEGVVGVPTSVSVRSGEGRVVEVRFSSVSTGA